MLRAQPGRRVHLLGGEARERHVVEVLVGSGLRPSAYPRRVRAFGARAQDRSGTAGADSWASRSSR
jgi:hypothetical protein